MHVGNYLGLVHVSQQQLADAFNTIAQHHQEQPDVYSACKLLGKWAQEHVDTLRGPLERYGEQKSPEPENLRAALFHGPRKGGLGLVRDLHDLWLLASEVELSWTVLYQASRALRDKELEAVCLDGIATAKRQLSWLTTRIKQAAPQALVAAGS